MDQVGPAVRELTPARGGEPSSGRVGRDGSLSLAFERRGPRTVLVERRFRTPLQLLEAIDLDGDPALAVVPLNPTGGVLGGDQLTTTVRLGPDAHVLLTSPSATRVYGTAGAASRLDTHVQLGAGASLEYIPDHLIPHPSASVVQQLTVDMAAGARLLLWDAWSLGRPARGERWRFQRLENHVRVQRDGRPLFIDRVALTPARQTLDGRGGSEGRDYVASWLAVSNEARDWSALANHLADAASSTSGVDAAGSALGQRGCLVRVLAASAHALNDTRRVLWSESRSALLGLPPLDLRKG